MLASAWLASSPSSARSTVCADWVSARISAADSTVSSSSTTRILIVSLRTLYLTAIMAHIVRPRLHRNICLQPAQFLRQLAASKSYRRPGRPKRLNRNCAITHGLNGKETQMRKPSRPLLSPLLRPLPRRLRRQRHGYDPVAEARHEAPGGASHRASRPPHQPRQWRTAASRRTRRACCTRKTTAASNAACQRRRSRNWKTPGPVTGPTRHRTVENHVKSRWRFHVRLSCAANTTVVRASRRNLRNPRKPEIFRKTRGPVCACAYYRCWVFK